METHGYGQVMAELDRYFGTTEIKANPTGFFRVENVNDRWWFITPQGHGFLSLGVNHIDSSALKYPDNIDVWKQNYSSEQDFLQRCVRADLTEWGFNTIGWTQEMGVRFLDHSIPWPHSSYVDANLPYCHLIRFTSMEMWNKDFSIPDVYGTDFEDWCDFQARQVCPDMAEDPNLIGYFYSDIPAWNSSRHGRPWMDRFEIETESGRSKFRETAGRYYQVIHDAIRRYDKNHLLLGDRYNGNPGIPDEILMAAKDSVDVISIQHFNTLDQFVENSRHYYKITGKPIINADVGFHIRPFGKEEPHGVKTQAERGQAYAKWAGACFDEPHFIGWHWCAYIANKVRMAGLKDGNNKPYTEAVDLIREFNRTLYNRVGR
mgnify:CR=1 FL=1